METIFLYKVKIKVVAPISSFFFFSHLYEFDMRVYQLSLKNSWLWTMNESSCEWIVKCSDLLKSKSIFC